MNILHEALTNIETTVSQTEAENIHTTKSLTTQGFVVFGITIICVIIGIALFVYLLKLIIVDIQRRRYSHNRKLIRKKLAIAERKDYNRRKNAVIRALKRCPDIKKVFNYVNLPNEKGELQTIDIIALSNKALYVIKTPLICSAVYPPLVDEDGDREWLMLTGLSTDRKYATAMPYSPTEENTKLIELLRETLGHRLMNQVPIINCIAFDNECIVDLSHFSNIPKSPVAIINAFSTNRMVKHYDERLEDKPNIDIESLSRRLKKHTKQLKQKIKIY